MPTSEAGSPPLSSAIAARLEDLLDRKDEEIAGLRGENEELARQIARGFAWMLHEARCYRVVSMQPMRLVAV